MTPRPRAGVMETHGDYARRSATQHGAAEFGFPLIARAIEDLTPSEDRRPLLLADFGAAQGTNSLAAIGRALSGLRRRAPGRAVFVVHADIPGNDFTTLADTLENSPDRYDREQPDVLPLMAARSLYQRFLPEGELDFGWSASTLHWLSSAPGPVNGHFFVQLSSDVAARARYAAQSATDWRDFLEARAPELALGAGLVIVDVAMDTNDLMGSEALFDRLNDALLACGERGLLSAGELAAMVYPTWFRSLDELRQPFAPRFTGAGGAELELAALEPVVMEDPFRDAFEESGDADAYARAQEGFLEGFLGPSFAAALDPMRPEPERQAALDGLWATARRLIAEDPRAVSPSYSLMTALVRRVA
jgi:hypothetical protein